jgi:RNA polymerase sporulation-specific sigma factor
MTFVNVLQQAIKGDPRSITQVVKRYTPLVQKFVDKYAWMAQEHSREDMVQEGILGIVKAIETYDLSKNTTFMTWVYPQVRGAVQNFARKELRRWPKNIEPWEHLDTDFVDIDSYELKESMLSSNSNMRIQDIITQCAGSPTSKRAQVVCARFGLLGRPPLRQGEVAKEFNMTKQAVNSHISSFSKKVREKYPDLFQFVVGG